MNEIIVKTMELIDVLESSSIVKEIILCKEKLLKDKNFLMLMEEYHNNNDSNIKEMLYQNETYRDYLENYQKLFFIVLKINNKYKNITNTRGCGNENY